MAETSHDIKFIDMKVNDKNHKEDIMEILKAVRPEWDNVEDLDIEVNTIYSTLQMGLQTWVINDICVCYFNQTQILS